MIIKKIKASNFRNLKNIDIEFGNINILTGKNSTGKTNFTQLLSHCLNTNPDVESYFGQNITTYQAGINHTTIETTISEKYASLNSGNFLFIINPLFTYQHTISKNPLYSKTQKLGYSGEQYEFESFTKFLSEDGLNHGKKEIIKINNVYSKNFESIKGLNKISEDNLKVFEGKGFNGIIGNEEITGYGDKYIKIYEEIVRNSIINDDNHGSYNNCTINIFKKVTEKNKELGLLALKNIDSKTKSLGYSDFTTAKFISLLSDVQKNENQFLKFNDELKYFTDGILRKVYINTEGINGSKGDIYIDSPNGPKDIDFISTGSAVILYFVLIKNWLELNDKSYKNPSVMIFDELDSSIHPSLISKFSELLTIISKKIQLFISTHSPIFIDCFSKENVFLLKDNGSFNEKVQVKSNILSYKDIINSLNIDEQSVFENNTNSELFINGYIDSLFPIKG